MTFEETFTLVSLGTLIAIFVIIMIDMIMIYFRLSDGIIAGVIDWFKASEFKSEAAGREHCRIGYLEKAIDGRVHISFNGKDWYRDEGVMAGKAKFEAEIAELYTRGSRDWWSRVCREESGCGSSFMDDEHYPLDTLGCGPYDLVSVDGGQTYLSLDTWGRVEGLAEDIHPGLLRYIRAREGRIMEDCGYIVGGWYSEKDRGDWQRQLCPKNTKSDT
jgi:hypothetical protein